MNAEIIRHIETQIGYTFQNKKLLQQAFTRRSYSQENPECGNNEVLEFIGDKVLDVIAVKTLDAFYGRLNGVGEYSSKQAEGRLTALKQKLVERKMLSGRVEIFGLQEYLIMGKGDRQNHVENEAPVKEDLFEAILGAVTVDSGWDFLQLESVVDCLLDPGYYLDNGFENDQNYVALIQQWCQKKSEKLPEYGFGQSKGSFCHCVLTLPCMQKSFAGEGGSKSRARMSAAKSAYEFLGQNGMLVTAYDEVGAPDPDRAINQLQELWQKGCIGEPEYDFSEEHDENGNPFWICGCRVTGAEHVCTRRDASKKQGKKKVAYEMLCEILGWEGKE